MPIYPLFSTRHELLARALLHFVQSLGSVPVLVPKRWHSFRSYSFIPAFPQPSRWNNHIQACTHIYFILWVILESRPLLGPAFQRKSVVDIVVILRRARHVSCSVVVPTLWASVLETSSGSPSLLFLLSTADYWFTALPPQCRSNKYITESRLGSSFPLCPHPVVLNSGPRAREEGSVMCVCFCVRGETADRTTFLAVQS